MSWLDDATVVLAHHKLAPVADARLEVVLSECPGCYAGLTDPLGLWRPLRVASRARTVRLICAVGCDADSIRDALQQPPPSAAYWRAMAADAARIAHEALAFAETHAATLAMAA